MTSNTPGCFRAITALGLAGCCLIGCTPVTWPSVPTTVQIATASAEIKNAGLTPADYASIGITLAQRSCADWFTKQVTSGQATSFGASALSMIGGAASAVGVVGGPAGAGIGAGASLLASLLGQAQASFGAGSNPAAIYSLVQRVQQAWLEAMPTPLTEADAFALVEDFVQKCELPGILSAVADAMHGATVTAAAPQPQLLAQDAVTVARARIRLPVVTVAPRQEPANKPRRDDAVRARLRREHEAIRRAGRNAYEGGPRELPPPVPLHHVPDPPPAPPAPIMPLPADPGEPSARVQLPPPDRVQGQPIEPLQPRNFLGTR